MHRIESCSIICKFISLADYKQAVDQKEHKKKLDIGRARRSRNVFRFIDDLTVLNDFSDFERRF